MTSSQHVYEIRSRKDNRGVDLISDELALLRPQWPNRSAPVKKVCEFI